MIRKLAFAFGATAVIGAAALTQTAALAKHWNHHWYGGPIVIAPTVYAAASDCYLVKRVCWKHSVKHVRYEEVWC
jgi:hypothetical protein